MEKDMTIQKIKSNFINYDCIQAMIPYRSKLTLLSQDEILYHSINKSSFSINRYLKEKINRCSWTNIPTFYERKPFFYRMHYVNQLLEFDKPYLEIRDSDIIEIFVVKNSSQALYLNKHITLDKQTEYMSRNQLEQILSNSNNESDYIYFLDSNNPFKNYENVLPNEKVMYSLLKDYAENSIIEPKLNSKSEYNIIKQNLKNDPFLLNSIEKNKNIEMIDFELQVCNNVLLISKKPQNDIRISKLDIYFIHSNHYKVDIYDIPIEMYSLAQLQSMYNLSTQPVSLGLNEEKAKHLIKSSI